MRRWLDMANMTTGPVSVGRSNDRFDDRAVWPARPMFTTRDQVLKRSGDPLQIDQMAADLLETSTGDTSDAASIRSILQLQQLSDLGQRETELLGAANEPKPCHFSQAVATDPRSAAGAAFGQGQQAAPLVVANRFDVDLRCRGQPPDRHQSGLHLYPALDSVPRYRV